MKIFKAIKKGFTLVELVIVIAVIAVLSAVLIPVFGNVVKDSRVSALKASLKTCTSNLIMYSLYNQVDYYTPSVIREFLKSEGIKGLTSDDSEFCEDGYSIWYNQENFNVILVKNEEIVNYVNAGSSTASVRNGNVATMAADIFGNVADGAVTGGVETSGASDKLGMLPRRPEAITPDENLLLIATDEANKDILKGIENIYRAADPGNSVSANEVLTTAVNTMKQCDLFNYFGSDWTVQKYCDKFDPQNTAWLNSSGYFYTDANAVGDAGDKTIEIVNVIVSPDIGSNLTEADKSAYDSVNETYKVSGGIRFFGDTQRNDVSLNILCTIEIASTVNIQLTKDFYVKNFKMKPSILISGNVTLDSAVAGSANAGGTSTVSTVTGGGSNISSVIGAGGGSAVIGGSTRPSTTVTMSPDEFFNWTTSSGSEGSVASKVISYETSTKTTSNATLVTVKKADGTYVTKEVSEEQADIFWKSNLGDDNQPVTYKYNTTSFSVDVNAFLTKTIIGNNAQSAKISQGNTLASILSSRLFDVTGESVDFDKKVASVDIEYNVARGSSVYSTRVFLTYYDDNGYLKKAVFNFGVGYISSFDHYYSFGNGRYILNAADYSDLTVASAKAGSVRLKLPDGALSLQSYKNGYSVEVVYDEISRYYVTEASDFGESFKRFVQDVKGNEKSIKREFKSTDITSDFTIDFNEFARIGSVDSADCYINTVNIKRIIIRDSKGAILIVKYPLSEIN